MKKHNGPDVVSVDEVADILGIGKNQAYAAVKNGQIPSVRVGRRVLISRKIVSELFGSTEKPKDKTEPTAVLPVHRVLRGGARLSSEQFNEFTETVSLLSDVLRDVGDLVMRLRRIHDELVRKSNQS
jgi:excisionase family DNA binding protein